MNPEQLSKMIEVTLGDRLQSVVLYGSSVTGDFVEGRSDYNLLVVTSTLRLADLQELMPLTHSWVDAGNSAPLFMTLKRLRTAAGVFVSEILDIKDSHRTLAGRELFNDLAVDTGRLRNQINYEFQSNLNKLQESYLLSNRQPTELHSVLVRSFASVGSLCRGALRLFTDETPPRLRKEAAMRLAEVVGIVSPVFSEIDALTSVKRLAGIERDFHSLFERYNNQLEEIIDAIDRLP